MLTQFITWLTLGVLRLFLSARTARRRTCCFWMTMTNVFWEGGFCSQGKLASFLAEWCVQAYPNLHGSNVSGKHCITQKCVNQRSFHILNINPSTRMNSRVQWDLLCQSMLSQCEQFITEPQIQHLIMLFINLSCNEFTVFVQ
jgi:hypothetical protein